MSLQSVQADLASRAPDLKVEVTDDSTATVQLAAEVHGVEPGQIAKTLCIRVNGEEMLLVTRGDARLDNRKCKDAFGARPRRSFDASPPTPYDQPPFRSRARASRP